MGTMHAVEAEMRIGPVGEFTSRPCKILLVDDSAEDRELLRYLITGAARVELDVLEAGTIAEAKHFCEAEQPDCILLDNRLPGESGMALLLEFCDEPNPPMFPIVMLTGTGDEEIAVQAMKSGAQDYLIKGRVTGDALWRSIQNAIEKVNLRHQVEEQRRELMRLASTDDLTALYNRRYFLNRLQEETTRALRYDMHLSVLLLDVDHFKRVNDRFGHPTGDRVLGRVAELIKQCLRRSDVGGRLGGEEFGVILTNTNTCGALIMANRLRTALERENFQADNGDPFKVTCSVGIAEFQVHTQDWDKLLTVADEALYEAKNAGRNQVVALKT